ncbi:MAG: Rpn family recombination-promoting nuclease/putative transposase [Lachnospiraceae bacterium]|nr:Rpn family recombination-promoting nuclease/putative transposase [Lachnospiraceae bacterium]
MTKEINNTAPDTVDEFSTQYDEQAKKVLGYKTVLAFILSKTVEEFKGMRGKDIADLIEGEVYISKVPVDPGYTNITDAERITGLNTEDSERSEGLIRYDILFKVRTSRDAKKSYGIIINVEMQKDKPTSYKLSNRAVFYACRLISAQKQREFRHMQFNNLVKVYSIWIVANMESNSVNHIHFAQDTLYGTYQWKGGTDMINIVIAGITGEPGKSEEDDSPEKADSRDLCRMLNTLFAVNLNNRERCEMLLDDFGIDIDEGLREEVKVMCNLGQGLLEKGERIGEQRGEQRGVRKAKEEDIINFYKVGGSLVMIAQAMSKTEEEIKEVLIDHGVILDH